MSVGREAANRVLRNVRVGLCICSQRMPQKYNLDPYVVHATFQFSGTEGKRHRMRESMLWIDPPEYHTRPGGYLVYKCVAAP